MSSSWVIRDRTVRMSTGDPDSTRTVWNDLPQGTRSRAVAGFIVHALLVAAAFRSLSKQDAANLRGPKILWKAVIPASIITLRTDTARVVPLGPLLYYTFGRRWRNSG